MKPSSDRRIKFWDHFNAVGKFIGYAFMVVGSIISVFGLLNALKRNDGGEAREFILVVIVALVVNTLGFLLVKAKPFSPCRLKPKDENSEEETPKK